MISDRVFMLFIAITVIAIMITSGLQFNRINDKIDDLEYKVNELQSSNSEIDR